MKNRRSQVRYLLHPPSMPVSRHGIRQLQIQGHWSIPPPSPNRIRHPASNRKIWEFESLRGRQFDAGRVLVPSMGSYPIANGRSIRPPATTFHAPVAQSGERLFVRQEAAGSKPAGGATYKRVNRAGPETALNTDRSRERLGFEYPALCHSPESEPDRVRARLESDATVETVGDRDLRSPPNREGNPIGDGRRLLSAWSRQASGSVPVPSANLSIRGHGRAVEGAWLQPRFS